MGIKIENLMFTYDKNSDSEYHALNNVSLTINKESFTAIVGHTGSGKSTLIQHLNAIILPQAGRITINDFILEPTKEKKSYKELRREVGLVFQFSEYQLFEETILKDVMFGPLNFGCTEEEASKRAYKYLKLVNIDEDLFDKSPFELSGGQKRRVAIAGILAMEPSIIVLDEPTAGLDPQGAIEIMNIFLEQKEKYHKTLVLVSHDMDFVYNYVDEVILLSKGEVIKHKDVVSFFNDEDIYQYSIEKPKLLKVYERYAKTKLDHKIDYDELLTYIKGVIDCAK